MKKVNRAQSDFSLEALAPRLGDGSRRLQPAKHLISLAISQAKACGYLALQRQRSVGMTRLILTAAGLQTSFINAFFQG
jgi:hypothetical protein